MAVFLLIIAVALLLAGALAFFSYNEEVTTNGTAGTVEINAGDAVTNIKKH